MITIEKNICSEKLSYLLYMLDSSSSPLLSSPLLLALPVLRNYRLLQLSIGKYSSHIWSQ